MTDWMDHIDAALQQQQEDEEFFAYQSLLQEISDLEDLRNYLRIANTLYYYKGGLRCPANQPPGPNSRP